LLALAAAGLGCDDDEPVAGPQVQLDIEYLQPLEAGRYELWVIEGGMAHLAGVVTPSATGEVDGALFDIPSQVTTAEMAVITYENDSDTDPSDSKIMGGAFDNSGIATFSMVGFALESEAFSANNTNGDFFLRTPSDEAAGNNGNDEEGVWFGTPGMPPDPDLALPALQPGWTYEGWVVNTSAGGPFPVTTGRFDDDQGVNGTAARDSDEQGPFGGTENTGPPVPGNDYVMDVASETLPAGLARPPFTLNDGNWMVVITLEPTDNDTPGPFSVKPLAAAVASGAATAPTTFSFGFDPLNSIPSGTASLVNGG
jgi:hypothetical protein